MDTSNITATDLQDEIISPINNEENSELVSKTMKDDKYMKISAGYTRSVIHDFESYPRTEIDLVEDDIRLVLDENNSSFVS